MVLEQALKIGKAGIAEDLREAHQGRGLHAGLVRHLGDGAERHVARMLPKEDGDLAQPLREMHGAGREYGAQLLIGSWFRVAKCCRQTALFSCCRLQAVRSWPVGCLATAAHTAYPLTAWNIRTSSGCGPLVGPRENAIAAQEF